MSNVEENYKRLSNELDKRLKADKRLEAIADKISKGKADFTDTEKYSHIVSQYMGEVISEYIGEITMPLGKEYVCKELLREHYDRINDVLGEVQASVDDKLGIHLNPIKAPFPTERVDKAAHSLEDPTVPKETIERRAKSATENIAESMHDDYIKENAGWRSQAGLDCYLVRDADGGCCKWCQALDGKYPYATAPDDIFRRHDNCKCNVTYICGKKRQDVWSKKTWEEPEDKLAARKELEEQSRATVNSKEQAIELEKKMLDKSQESGIIEPGESGFWKISMQFFAEKDIENQESGSLRRAMRKYEKRIEEHKEYISNPKSHCPNWDSLSDNQKSGLIRHWEKEIRNFEESIQNRVDELKERGEYDE